MEHVAMEIETLLARLTDVVEAMEAYLASNAAASGNPTMAHTLERHSEILNDYKREFRKRKVRKNAGDLPSADQARIRSCRFPRAT
mmetsp:Transcript_29365/g.113744  ORF Transcript_29365/g.113744 Transcript_29365/m.113744 type:complete len:86 (-) Transcript_29365:1522-1779(-)